MKKAEAPFKNSKKFDLQRKVVSHMTTMSWKNIPHVSYLYEPDITEFYNEFSILTKKRNEKDKKISLNTILLKAIIEGLKAAPELNSWIEYNHRKGEGSIRLCNNINISLPWLLPDGRMITPVISNVESMTLEALSNTIFEMGKKIKNTNVDELLYQAVISDTFQELKKFRFGIIRRVLASKISFHPTNGLSGKEKKDYYKTSAFHRLSENNLVSGTVTVSNIGSLYKEQRGYFGILEIIPPQIFAIGLGAIQERPGVYVCEDGHKEIGIRKVLPMCLAFDHRAIDFNTLVPFMKKLDEIFANPDIIQNW